MEVHSLHNKFSAFPSVGHKVSDQVHLTAVPRMDAGRLMGMPSSTHRPSYTWKRNQSARRTRWSLSRNRTTDTVKPLLLRSRASSSHSFIQPSNRGFAHTSSSIVLSTNASELVELLFRGSRPFTRRNSAIPCRPRLSSQKEPRHVSPKAGQDVPPSLSRTGQQQDQCRTAR